MRIRRRPPGQPLAYLLPIDPPAAPQSASIDHLQERRRPPVPVPGDGEPHLHPASATNHSAADLGVARSSSPLIRRPALPLQDGSVERSMGLLQQLQQGPADGRSISLENGLHRHVPEPVTNLQAGGELLINNNGVGAAVTMTATMGAEATEEQQQQEETNDTSGGGGTTRAPRGPGTLLEGSRCSRKNGRGWRCIQQTLVGYALCQYHLGKGRIKSGTAGRGRGRGRGPGQLGRTEHANRTTSDAAVAPATTAAEAEAEPDADVLPPPPPRERVAPLGARGMAG